jgi:hypothetical protein
MKARTVNVRHEPYDVFVGRPSKWGNPYREGRDGSREEVINKYEAFVRSRPDLLASLPELRGKRLGCWCWPQKCHADVLARMAEEG